MLAFMINYCAYIKHELVHYHTTLLFVCLVAARLYKFSAGSLKITQVNMISYIFILTCWIFSYLGSIVILLFNNAEFNNLIDNILGGPKNKTAGGSVFPCHDCYCRGHDHREYLFSTSIRKRSMPTMQSPSAACSPNTTAM